MVRTHRDETGGVHGPCERCGVAFTSDVTTCRPMCPNCGHRALSPPAPRGGGDDRLAPGQDGEGLRVRLRGPRGNPFDPDDRSTWACWRLN